MTKYPKDKKWTIKELDAITEDWKGNTLNDGDGLTGEVRVKAQGGVTIAFRYGFKLKGKKVWYYCGLYPTLKLKDIRKNRNDAKEAIEQGIDPRAKKVADKIKNQELVDAVIEDSKRKEDARKAEIENNLTLGELFDVWIRDGVARADGNKLINLIFKKHALPSLSGIPLRELSDKHILEVLRAVFNQDKNRTAIMLHKDLSQMLRWAEKRKPYRALLIDGNPSALIKIENLIPSDYKEERTRTLSDKEIRRLNSIFTESEIAYEQAPIKYNVTRPVIKETQLAVWICLSTVSRIGELLTTEWSHVNFEDRTWYIPKENVKGTRRNKQAQLVYLSDFALDKFKQLHELTKDSKWAFPASSKSIHASKHVNVKTVSKQVGDRQTRFKNLTRSLSKRVNDDSLVLGEEKWTPHDMRRTGSTIMQGVLKVSLDVIDRCQNHVLAGGKIRRHYLHHEYSDEKRDAWYKLGERLEIILNSSNVRS